MSVCLLSIGLKTSRGGAVLASILLLLVVGCNTGPESGDVEGVVTFNGEAVTQGTVTFYPTEGGRPASGEIQPDGTYELATLQPGDGALVGKYKVAIEARQIVGSAPEPKSLEEEIAMQSAPSGKASVKWLVPQEFASAESSELTATVNSGRNQIDFRLP